MAPRVEATEDLVEELVHQFSDPYAFYRELIQNSIDAGSSRVEVTLRFRPGPEQGLCTATVADWGEGMNRRIIEDYLLTKFRSTKENDLTKIGKFGIGFVSVFASAPELVVVETGRDAEYWRLVFQKDRSYQLYRAPEPIDGTRVSLYKQLSAAQYQEFVAKSFGAVRRWCRHSQAEVVFAAGSAAGSPPEEHAPVQEPLAVDAPYQVEHREEGTRIVAGPARKLPAELGLYNRGLTLLESREEQLFPGVALKVVSRYLEHTLTRDNVRRDQHFQRAMELCRKLVEGPLLERLPEELKLAAERAEGGEEFRALFSFASGKLGLEQLWLRLWGGAAPAEQVRRFAREQGALLSAPQLSPTVARMRAAGMPVLEGDPLSEWIQEVKKLLGLKEARLAEEAFTFAEVSEELALRPFLSALETLLQLARARSTAVTAGVLHGGGSGRVCILVEAPGRPLPASRALRSPFGKEAPPLLCLNRAHPQVVPLLRLGRESPRLAAYLTARLLGATFEALDEPVDRALTERALGG